MPFPQPATQRLSIRTHVIPDCSLHHDTEAPWYLARRKRIARVPLEEPFAGRIGARHERQTITCGVIAATRDPFDIERVATNNRGESHAYLSDSHHRIRAGEVQAG